MCSTWTKRKIFKDIFNYSSFSNATFVYLSKAFFPTWNGFTLVNIHALPGVDILEEAQGAVKFVTLLTRMTPSFSCTFIKLVQFVTPLGTRVATSFSCTFIKFVQLVTLLTRVAPSFSCTFTKLVQSVTLLTRVITSFFDTVHVH